MSRSVLILGGGTGGTLTANRLRRELDDDVRITVVDKDDDHVYQPGLLFLPFGLTDRRRTVRPRERQLHRGIEYLRGTVGHVEVDHDRIRLEDGRMLGYDVLVVATGADLLPQDTEGLIGPGWRRSVHTFYDLDGSMALAGALRDFRKGHLVINVLDLPIKCPVAPLEFCFLADWYFHACGIRDDVQITYVTPLDAAFTRPVAAQVLAGLLDEKRISLITDFTTGRIDGTAGRLTSYDDRVVDFDLAVVVPLHGGAPYVSLSDGLGDELGFVDADRATLQSRQRPNVFAIGDAAGLPASKAGSVAHFEGEILVHNINRFLQGRPLDAAFDGHTNCFIETGFHKAMLVDFNYDTEPLPGRYPTAVGLPLLRQSRLNHLGKQLFRWLYWHTLLPGHDIPGLTSVMPQAGKRQPDLSPADPTKESMT